MSATICHACKEASPSPDHECRRSPSSQSPGEALELLQDCAQLMDNLQASWPYDEPGTVLRETRDRVREYLAKLNGDSVPASKPKEPPVECFCGYKGFCKGCI